MGHGGPLPSEGNQTGTHRLERSFSEDAGGSCRPVLAARVRRQAIPGDLAGSGAVGSSEEAVQLGLQVVPHLAHLAEGGGRRAG